MYIQSTIKLSNQVILSFYDQIHYNEYFWHKVFLAFSEEIKHRWLIIWMNLFVICVIFNRDMDVYHFIKKVKGDKGKEKVGFFNDKRSGIINLIRRVNICLKKKAQKYDFGEQSMKELKLQLSISNGGFLLVLLPSFEFSPI